MIDATFRNYFGETKRKPHGLGKITSKCDFLTDLMNLFNQVRCQFEHCRLYLYGKFWF